MGDPLAIDPKTQASIMVVAGWYYEVKTVKTISLKLPESLDKQICWEARRRGTTKSKVVRSAIESFVKQRRGKVKGSCLELAGDIIGSVEGPPDLSTNKKYMEGFGE